MVIVKEQIYFRYIQALDPGEQGSRAFLVLLVKCPR